jgi:hypothetical protein
MPRLSAIDAVTRAIERTKAMPLRPFRFKTWMLMGIIGWLAGEGGGASFNFGIPTGPHGSGRPMPAPPHAPGSHFPLAGIALLVVVGLLVVLAVVRAFLSSVQPLSIRFVRCGRFRPDWHWTRLEDLPQPGPPVFLVVVLEWVCRFCAAKRCDRGFRCWWRTRAGSLKQGHPPLKPFLRWLELSFLPL